MVLKGEIKNLGYQKFLRWCVCKNRGLSDFSKVDEKDKSLILNIN